MKLKWIIIPVLIVVAAILTISCSKKHRDIPEKLIGKWITSAPRYEDRFIEITKETIAYGLGGDKEDINFISSIEESLEGNRILYSITYKNKEGLAFTRFFYYHPENGGTIQFKHQEHITWRKMKNDVSKENSEPDQNKKAGQNETNS